MRKLFFGLFFIITIIIIWINLKLYSENFTLQEKQFDIIKQLNFLEIELKSKNLGERMQEVFPEGFVFTNALYGLSWCEIGIADFSNDSEIKRKALNEALFAYNEINSDKGKSMFDNHLYPANGIFYVGWNNYLLSKILCLDTTFKGYDKYKNTFIEQSELIVETMKNSKSPYLESYQNQSWPADMFVAMASVSNYDKIFKPKFKNEIQEWLKNVELKLDTKTKLIPHKVNSRTARTMEGARGSSISLIIRLLAEIEPQFAKNQFELYKKNFVTTTFGLSSIREYPKGQFGEGDIDSGPVIFGVGFSGTIVSVGTFSILGNQELAEMQYKTINAFGFPISSDYEKKYVFGLLPIADAFIAWSRASGLNQKSISESISIGWRIQFHLISILVIALIWILFYFKRLKNNLKLLLNKAK